MKSEWFRAHFEFRFPEFGKVSRHGVAMELRPGDRALARSGREGDLREYVDSSVKRLQVKARG
ncbi:MAG: transglutaminase family protein [Isosphaeraceae bacterium]